MKVTIDGQAIEARAGETILEVARRAGIWIPTLCHHDALAPYAACRICVVEIESGGRTQVVTACNYPVRDDLAVRVNSERAVRDRQGVIELMLARCPDSPELRSLAARMGVPITPYPHVTEAVRNCILCGLCVRVCAEAVGASAISPTGRGVDRVVAAPFRLAAEDCIGCGACAAVCPVGTIVTVMHEEDVEIVPFDTRVKFKRCAECGEPLATQLVDKALRQRGGPTLVEILDRQQFCPKCKRKRSAAQRSEWVGSR